MCLICKSIWFYMSHLWDIFLVLSHSGLIIISKPAYMKNIHMYDHTSAVHFCIIALPILYPCLFCFVVLILNCNMEMWRKEITKNPWMCLHTVPGKLILILTATTATDSENTDHWTDSSAIPKLRFRSLEDHKRQIHF